MKGYSDILGSVDSAFYYVERKETPMNIGALTIFEGTMDFEVLTQYVEARLEACPRYHDRIVQAPFRLGQPTWINDPDFYIGDHVKRVRLPEPGTHEQLRVLAGDLVSKTLNRSHPLWEIYCIEGLKGKTALLFKVHHCMVDGLAAVELFTFLTDFTPDYTAPTHPIIHDAPRLPDSVDLLVDSLWRDAEHHLKLLRKLGTESFKLLGNLTEESRRLKMLVGILHVINGNLRPIKKLPINGRNTGKQTLVWAEFALDDVHTIRATRRASVNDVMLTVLARAIESYTAAHGGSEQKFVRMLVPVNVRHDEEKGEYGNRISVLPIDVPFHTSDPLEHLDAVRRYSQVMKESGLAFTMDLVLTLPSLMPSVAQKPIWDLAPTAFALLAHTWCTNVASPPVPVYLLGHQLEHVYGFFPLNPSMGLAAVIVSYNGRITLTLVLDEGIVRDARSFEGHMKDAFRDLAKAAHVPLPASPRTAVERPVDMPQSEPPPAAAPASLTPQASVPSAELLSIPAPPAASFTNGKKDEAVDAPKPARKPRRKKTVASEPPVFNAAAADSATVEAEISPAPEAVPAPEPPAPTAAPAPEVVVVAAPLVKPADPAPAHPRLFSEPWAQQFREVINSSRSYRDASTGWTAGSLALVIEASPANGFDQPAAVWLDLHRGVCRGARATTPDAARRDADFVIQGSYAAWMDALNGRASPLAMLTTGRLQLKKGLLLRLLPFTRSANELVGCAQRVPWS
jgi:WS/DGAT/MGAT family acyltransferase